MGSLLGQLIPAALVAALAPLPITIVVTLLMSKGGVAKAVAFAGALLAVFAIIGVITLTTSSGNSGSTSKGSAVTGTILAVLGVLFLVIAVKQLLNAPDPDAPPPKFMTALDTMSVPRATVFGAILALINVKQLGIFVGGLSQIIHADVSSAGRWTAFVVFLIVVQIGVIAPILVFLVAPGWASAQLLRFREWLVRNNRVIGIVLGLAIGIWFTIKGVAQIA
jgi:threonine/homoserine/homoserine lactone efflux protein